MAKSLSALAAGTGSPSANAIPGRSEEQLIEVGQFELGGGTTSQGHLHDLELCSTIAETAPQRLLLFD